MEALLSPSSTAFEESGWEQHQLSPWEDRCFWENRDSDGGYTSTHVAVPRSDASGTSISSNTATKDTVDDSEDACSDDDDIGDYQVMVERRGSKYELKVNVENMDDHLRKSCFPGTNATTEEQNSNTRRIEDKREGTNFINNDNDNNARVDVDGSIFVSKTTTPMTNRHLVLLHRF